MPNLNQGAWVSGSDEYRFAYNSIPVIPITGAPDDANFARWAMLHDGADYRLYLFRGSSSDTLYQFAWNGSSYEYGYRDPGADTRRIAARRRCVKHPHAS